LFNNLDLLRCYDKKDMAKEIWFVRYGFGELSGERSIRFEREMD
jgi:hypothetical protein